MSETTTPGRNYLLSLDRATLTEQQEVLTVIIDKVRRAITPEWRGIVKINTDEILALDGLLDLCDELAYQSDCEVDPATTSTRQT